MSSKQKPVQPSEPRKADTVPLATHVNAKSGSKVVVLCKLPMGFVLEIDRLMDVVEAGPMQQRVIQQWVKEPGGVRLHGNRARFNEMPEWEIVGGYGITENVDEHFWEKWLAQNKDQAYVKNHLIMAFPDLASAKAAAREHKALLSGMEPLNTATRRVIDKDGNERTTHVDPRWPKQVSMQGRTVSEVDTGDRAA